MWLLGSDCEGKRYYKVSSEATRWEWLLRAFSLALNTPLLLRIRPLLSAIKGALLSLRLHYPTFLGDNGLLNRL